MVDDDFENIVATIDWLDESEISGHFEITTGRELTLTASQASGHHLSGAGVLRVVDFDAANDNYDFSRITVEIKTSINEELDQIEDQQAANDPLAEHFGKALTVTINTTNGWKESHTIQLQWIAGETLQSVDPVKGPTLHNGMLFISFDEPKRANMVLINLSNEEELVLT